MNNSRRPQGMDRNTQGPVTLRGRWILIAIVAGFVGLACIHWLGSGAAAAPEKIAVKTGPSPAGNQAWSTAAGSDVHGQLVLPPAVNTAPAPAMPPASAATPAGSESAARASWTSAPAVDPALTQIFTTLQSDPMPQRRARAVDELRMLGMHGDPGGRIHDALRAASNDPDPTVAVTARDAISVLLD
jgi:hypothetical protein